MATSYRQIFYHIVFRTKSGERTLSIEHSEELYKYIWGVLQKKECMLYRINGMKDHVHLLCELNPRLALADLVRDIKVSSSIWLKANVNFPDFSGWAVGYAALTCSWREKDRVIAYIKNQREHHKKVSFLDEYRAMLQENGIVIDERYFP